MFHYTIYRRCEDARHPLCIDDAPAADRGGAARVGGHSGPDSSECLSFTRSQFVLTNGVYCRAGVRWYRKYRRHHRRLRERSQDGSVKLFVRVVQVDRPQAGLVRVGKCLVRFGVLTSVYCTQETRLYHQRTTHMHDAWLTVPVLHAARSQWVRREAQQQQPMVSGSFFGMPLANLLTVGSMVSIRRDFGVGYRRHHIRADPSMSGKRSCACRIS